MQQFATPARRRLVRRIVMRTALGVAPIVAVDGLRRRRDVLPSVVGAAVAATLVESGPLGVPALAVLVHPRVRRRPVAVAAASAAAVATVAVWPVVPDSPARARPVVDRPLDEPLPAGRGLVVVANPASGSGTGRELIAEIRRALPEAEIIELAEDDDVVTVLDTAAAEAAALGVVGGDGTVNAAARVAGAHGIPLAVFPGGTLNHFARALGLETVTEAVDAVTNGWLVAVDLATIGDRWFLNNASIGGYSDLVDERERLEHRLGKWPAMLVAATRVARRGEPIDVCIDGRQRQVWMVFVGNGQYQPAGFAPVGRADLTDGVLDVRVLDAGGRLSRIRLVAALAFGGLARSPVYHEWTADCVELRVGGDTSRVAADGETFDASSTVIATKRRLGLRVFVPDREVGT